jgi:LPS export ABC transporter protein LptC
MIKIIQIIILLTFAACSEEKIQPQIDKSSINGEIPSHESWNSKVMFTENGKLKAVLFSDHIRKYETKRETNLSGVKINFYDSEQKNTSVLTSVRGKVDDITRDMYAYENVIAKNDSGVVLKTEELKWRNSDQKIITDRFVSISSPKENIEGYGFESDQSLRNYTIFKVIYSTIVSSAKKKE